MSRFQHLLRSNLILYLTLGVFVTLLLAAAQGMESRDFVITLLRGLAVGSLTFLVASGFSLILGLLHVLNLAHGTLFMLGAYIGWTAYVRPDTFIDLLTPVALLMSGFLLKDVWAITANHSLITQRLRRILPWLALVMVLLLLAAILPRYPVTHWSVDDYSLSPVAIAHSAGQGLNVIPPSLPFTRISPWLAFSGLLLASALGAFALSLLAAPKATTPRLTWRSFAGFGVAVLAGIFFFVFNDRLTELLAGLNSNWKFLTAVIAAIATGAMMGALLETTLIRPLYARPLYQIMLTLGLSVVGIEMVHNMWGRPEFTMPRPALFAGTGAGCPATTFADWWQYSCSTMLVLGGRVRVYNEIFLPLVGLAVLLAVWILLKQSRLGMIIRAGVQDREMVEALGINVQRVFTQVFALGVGLAALGGVLAAPSIGLSNHMGESFLLNALIALAIGGLTSFPGAALGSMLVGLTQQFMIKYGQIGIPLPFTEAVFKPTPPIVPASTILLMVVILLLMPNGLLGKKE
jgi:branched-chain amino acid transport system permease protein